MTEDLEPLRVPARDIPPPSTISAEARRVLSTMASQAPEPGQSRMSYPPADDREAWATLRGGFSRTMGIDTSTLGIDTKVVDDVVIHACRPDEVRPQDAERLYLDIHGGALVMGSGDACMWATYQAMLQTRVVTWGVDYRLPPEFPYPTPLDDCVVVYRTALGQHRPEDIVVGGISAGGNLAAALMLRLRAEGLPRPAGLVLITPELDLTESGDSFQTNKGVDSVLWGSLAAANQLYAGGHDLGDPYVSPLLGDVTDFPPTFLQAGTRDLFLSNAAVMHRKLRAAGIDAELHVWEAMPHGGFLGGTDIPEANEITIEVRAWLAKIWP